MLHLPLPHAVWLRHLSHSGTQHLRRVRGGRRRRMLRELSSNYASNLGSSATVLLYETLVFLQGDSGGPMGVYHEGKFHLVGIVSWGNRCGAANLPGVYIDVSFYLDWIERIIDPHVSAPPPQPSQ